MSLKFFFFFQLYVANFKNFQPKNMKKVIKLNNYSIQSLSKKYFLTIN